jgi:transcription-repair coupling factor
MKPSLLLGDDTHRDVAQLLEAKRRLVLSGASNETAKALLLSHILSFNSRPTLLVTDSVEHCETWDHWLNFFDRAVSILRPVVDDEGNVLPDEVQTFLKFMQCDCNDVFLCSRDTWDKAFPSFAEFADNKVVFKKGNTIDFTKTVEALVAMGYRHGEDLYLEPGEYRRTGDVIDIFPIQEDHSFKISLEFDKVEKIIAVDKDDLTKTEDAGKTLEACPILYEDELALEKQIPSEALLVLDDQDDIQFPLKTMGMRFTPFPETDDNHIHVRYLSVLKFYTLTDFLNDIRDKLAQGWSLFIVTKRLEELEGICIEEKIPHTSKPERKAGALTLVGAEDEDLLPHSIQNPDEKFALLTDREIFSLKKAGKQRSVQKLALDFITSLVPGDYVVHMEHGIGLFEGMTQKEVDEMMHEYLELTYAEGDKLFIPVDQADKLSKFVYEEGNEPQLTRLGTQEWKKVTAKMKEETQKIAKELLGLYAKRAKAKGFAYNDDTKDQRKFDEAFPYQETPGQLKAIEDLKKDMEADYPMDRLVCGDVGFGKTEVAMRAAFKAVQDGKQVAFLAPITILADQHYKSLQERMKDFNVRIEMLSRFKKPKAQKEILEKLRKGDVDIVIGTHRLLQPDVEFFNLGLVIVDEEQRFGVKQKEKFKEMRAAVDVLTLTATPIPRTLNLGLHKLRDITTITTPPPGRLPIVTEVRKYSDEMVRKAILDEIARDGQVYMLHNRVETIDAYANKLRELVPEATFIVGHGQLKPEDLEKRIVDFKAAKYNVLVSSTIIENGIDLPKANTLIVNGAENFGLSQLYQLRGRVGRSKLQAYAFFLYHGAKLKDDARKRLRAIVEACELGSGFQVAMRDLEIRGAGEILGAHQSGTMHTVGVSHYLRMLKAAVEEIKAGGKGRADEDINVEILLPVEAMIPTFYIPDEQEKISVYQKLAGSEDEKILKEFEDDIEDEYGKPPEQVENLFAVLKLKMVCRQAGVLRIKEESGSPSTSSGQVKKDDKEIVLTLAERVTAKEIMQLLKVNPQWRVSGNKLKIYHSDIVRKSSDNVVKWLGELAKEVGALIRKTKKRK